MMSQVEIDFGDRGNELGDYLIEREKSQNSNSISGFFSNVGSNVTRFLPKRTGTGSIEDDIAVRFGLRSNSVSTSDSSGVGNGNVTSGSGWGYQMSRKERIITFFVLLGMGILFFILSGLYLPLLLLKARKFSIFFTLGSVFSFASLSVLWGFTSFLRHLVSSDRIVFTVMYFGSLFCTLYFAIGLQSTILTIVGIVFQVLSLISFIVSYLPGGIAGMKYLTKFISSSLTRSMPI